MAQSRERIVADSLWCGVVMEWVDYAAIMLEEVIKCSVIMSSLSEEAVKLLITKNIIIAQCTNNCVVHYNISPWPHKLDY